MKQNHEKQKNLNLILHNRSGVNVDTKLFFCSSFRKKTHDARLYFYQRKNKSFTHFISKSTLCFLAFHV